MKLVLTEEEQFLKDTAKNFADERSPITHFRALRDNNDPLLWDKDLWSEMTKLGWPGILIPEDYGGSNFGVTGISVILNECAKNSDSFSIVRYWSYRRIFNYKLWY